MKIHLLPHTSYLGPDIWHLYTALSRSMKTSKLRVTGLCAGNAPGTGEFPAQMASYAENVSIWWRHHDMAFIYGCIGKWCLTSVSQFLGLPLTHFPTNLWPIIGWPDYSMELAMEIRTTRTPAFWDTSLRPMITHTSDSHQIPNQKKTKSKLQILRKLPNIQILKFCTTLYMRHTFWCCLIRCINMKWIQPEL